MAQKITAKGNTRRRWTAPTGGIEDAEGKMKPGAIETTAPLIADPELGEVRCPNGHDSAIPVGITPRKRPGTSSALCVASAMHRWRSTGARIA
jgi:hypothetical protein